MMKTRLLQSWFTRLCGIKFIAAVVLVVLCSFGSANAGSFVAECEKNNELEVRFSGSNCDLVWNKGGESTLCKIKNSVMKFSSYDSGGQATLDLKSGVLKGMGGVYKCTLSGDIQVGKQKKEVKSVLNGGQLTEQDRQALIGTYGFKGDVKKGRKAKELVVEITISLDNAGQLIGHHRYTRKKFKGRWNYSVFRNYRRLSASEWTHDWKIISLPGGRCDKDRLCLVADHQFYYWLDGVNKHKKHHEIWKRLSQFTLDYKIVENYSMNKKGHGGGASTPYQRVSESEVLSFVWCALGNTLAHTTKGICTTHKGKQFATKEQAETETNMKWKGGLPREDKTSAVQQGQGTAIELEFWKSIKSSDDPDMFQAYLDEYPNGKFVPLAKIKIKKLKTSVGDDK